MNKHRLLILAAEGISTNILYNSLKNEYNIEAIIIEQPVSRKEFLKKRIKKLGRWNVFGQILFQISIVPFLNFFSSNRKREIIDNYNLDDSPLPEGKIIRVNSVNSVKCISYKNKPGINNSKWNQNNFKRSFRFDRSEIFKHPCRHNS